MLDWLRYRYELARLRRTHRRVLAPLREEYQEEDQRAKSEDEILEALTPTMEEMDYYHDRVAVLQTRYLSNVESKRLIPLPEQSKEFVLKQINWTENWRRPKHGIMPILTDEAIMELRRTLRTDRRERLEIIRSWVATIVPGLTGLIGVIIGLLAVILGRR